MFVSRFSLPRLEHPFIFTVLMVSIVSAATIDPPDKTVRVFYILPNDVPLDSAYPEGIAKVMKSSQRYFMEQCKFTFRLNDPACEVVKGNHPRSWYENNECGADRYWCAVNNGQQDLLNSIPSVKNDGNRSRWKIIFYIDAEGTGAGGGGGGGWVLLPKHDADGARGFPKDTARWCGGMCHELGHCFGLPDASRDDGTVMSADFYHWPVNCIFNSNHISTMKNLAANSGFWVNEITETAAHPSLESGRKRQWVPVIQDNHLVIPLTAASAVGATVGIYDLSGRCVTRISQVSVSPAQSRVLMDLSTINAGTYICSFEKNGISVKQPLNDGDK